METRSTDHSATLRRRIQKLRIYTDDGDRCFVPQKSLYNLLTREELRNVLTSCNGVLSYHVDELVEIIFRGARRIFAILILLKGEEELISDFVRSDGFQLSALDHKLPFSKETLSSIVSPDAIDDFYIVQWEFVAPVFSKGILHRVLDPRTRLPFICHRDTGKEGGFGHIYELEIHPEYHRFTVAPGHSVSETNSYRTVHLLILPVFQPRLVRKEFLPNTADPGSFENELHNLNLLSNLRHPNIVELLGSWTYRGKHNALFPCAEGGDLSQLLSSKIRPYHFLEDSEFYRALSELSSAIQKVHQYTSEKLNLSLIGVHRDLRPQNILVHEGSFILADFGLSKFKNADQSSKSLFRLGEGYHLAPECEDYEGGFEKHAISRPSDIWSFGCIVAEILTYMSFGADGVAKFKNDRKIKIGSFITYTFHAGLNKPNPGVTAWLKHLDCEVTESGRILLYLIKSMLSIDPGARPTAEETTSYLCYTSIDAYSRSIETQFGVIQKDISTTELQIEEQRFKSWFRATKSYNTDTDPWKRRPHSVLDFDVVLKTLTHVRDELISIRSRLDDALSPRFLELQHLNDRLLTLLPWEGQERAKTDFELQIIQTIDDDLLADGQMIRSEDALHRKIGLLATMKRMNVLVSERTKICRFDLHLKLQYIQVLEPHEDHSLALFNDPSVEKPRRVLIEWVRYDTHWEGSVSEEMYARMEAIAELLHESSKPEDLRVLTCLGFFHDQSRLAFGFVYDFPNGTPAFPQIRLRSLSAVLEETKNSRNRPSLDDRFKLAWLIASSLLEFHKVGWMHKSISAYNVLFFTSSDQPSQFWIKNPYIIGFNRSRPDQPAAFTEGPNMDLKSQSYQHPGYVKDRRRFCPGFDYYSLGIVLLGIGLWQTVEEMVTKIGPTSQEEIIDRLLLKRVPLLNHAMGTAYCKAVRSCITWTFDHKTDAQGNLTEEEKVVSLLDFEQSVVEPLAQCSR